MRINFSSQKKEAVGDDAAVPSEVLENLDGITQDQLTVGNPPPFCVIADWTVCAKKTFDSTTSTILSFSIILSTF